MAAPKRQEGAATAPREEELPQIKTLTIGALPNGQAALLWLTSVGQKVTARELLDVGTQEQVDSAWREEAYHRVWRQEPEPSPASRLETAKRVAPFTGKDVVSGHGYGLCRKNGSWALYEVHHEGERVTSQRVLEAGRDFMFMWERFDTLTARFLVVDRRRA